MHRGCMSKRATEIVDFKIEDVAIALLYEGWILRARTRVIFIWIG